MKLNAFLFESVSYLKSDEAFDPFSKVALGGPLLPSALLSRSHPYSSSYSLLMPFSPALRMDAVSP